MADNEKFRAFRQIKFSLAYIALFGLLSASSIFSLVWQRFFNMIEVADQDLAKVKDISRAACKVSRRTSRTNINPHLKAFLQNTSLHGVKYIGNGNIHWMERLFWCSVLITCSISLVAVSRMKWFQWKETPITIERANAPHHISTLPIPAITYCGKSYSHENVTIRWNETEMLEILKPYVETNIVNIVNDGPFNNFFKINNTQNSIGTRFKITTSRFKEIMSGIDVTFLSPVDGLRHGTYTYCFQTFTSKGFCTSCNIFPPSKLYKNTTVHHSIYHLHETQEKGYVTRQESTNDTIHGFPLMNEVEYKVIPPVSHEGDTIIMYNVTIFQQYPMKVGDFEIWDSIYVGGYLNNMYALHNPWDIPSPFMRWHHIENLEKDYELDERIAIGLDHYNYYKTTPELILQINIEPELTLQYPLDDNPLYKISSTNQCYSTTGKELEFFQYYTQQNCLLECFSRKMLKECGCVMFYMPHYETTHICSTKNTSCEMKVYKDMYDISDENSVNYCDCLPNCNSTEYKVISIEEYNSPTNIFDRSSVLRIVFRDDFFYPRIRTYTYTKFDIIESAIFYLDIFLGISILTIAEIFYYLALYVVDCFKR